MADKVLIKNGQNKEDLTLFKDMRDKLAISEQVKLARRLNLQIANIDNLPPEATGVITTPVLRDYLVKYEVVYSVSATSPAQALDLAEEQKDHTDLFEAEGTATLVEINDDSDEEADPEDEDEVDVDSSWNLVQHI